MKVLHVARLPIPHEWHGSVYVTLHIYIDIKLHRTCKECLLSLLDCNICTYDVLILGNKRVLGKIACGTISCHQSSVVNELLPMKFEFKC